MFDKTKKSGSFSAARIEDHARTADVVNRAKAVTNGSLAQSADRLDPIPTGKGLL